MRNSRIPMIIFALVCSACDAERAAAQTVTYQPYIEPGNAGKLDESDQMVVAWQTNESAPHPGAYKVDFGRTASYGSTASVAGRVVDSYLAADPSLPVPSDAVGAHVNYTAVLKGLRFDSNYFYRVSGPGLPAGGFTATFLTRTRSRHFSFLVQGDEGFFPAVPNTNPPRIADYEARIVHLMYNAHKIDLPGETAPRPEPNLALNTGDNVYTFGAEGSYRDFWFPVWNNDVDSNETGAPFIRRYPFYIVVGNHDIGGSGDRVNLLGSDSSPRFSGNADGGDLLQYYNNYYFPLNGPLGVDPYFVVNGDSGTTPGYFFSFMGHSYTSPAAAEALRASTSVDSGAGPIRQIDHMSNYSFDEGNVHFLFLDANPHVFNAILNGAANFAGPPTGFTPYPSVLRQWIINDLDSSRQDWKVVVFHQPAFSSGNATLRNYQMRLAAKVLEDHGVNIVFNGHEHNYQRTLPIRALAGFDQPATTAGDAVVAVDAQFDGVSHQVPDGVLYVVEGAGGNRDFDGNFGPARGSGTGVDQDDSAAGATLLSPTLNVANGPASWLDTHLTNNEMTPFFPTAGSGQKITVRFKAKLFSFAQVVVDDNKMTLYQISEPLQSTSSATAQNPAPFGTDVNGNPVNDPIPDTLVDPATGRVVSPSADGPSVLLDKFTLLRPILGDDVQVQLGADSRVAPGGQITYKVHVSNGSAFALNGTQIVLNLPGSAQLSDATSDNLTVDGSRVVVTLGRLDPGQSRDLLLHAQLGAEADGSVSAHAFLKSSTAQSIRSNTVETGVSGIDDSN